MEDASKALLMAAGILIGILIISLAVYLFRSVAGFSNEYDETQITKELSMYNNKFEKYEGRSNLTIHDIVSVKNLAEEYEKNYNEKITVKLDGVLLDITDINERIKKDIDENTSTEGIMYSCTSIGYENGRVNSINFRKNT